VDQQDLAFFGRSGLDKDKPSQSIGLVQHPVNGFQPSLILRVAVCGSVIQKCLVPDDAGGRPEGGNIDVFFTRHRSFN
jgi:hypothetical protein